MSFLQGDLVTYSGDKSRPALSGVGEVCAAVGNEPNAFVVAFGRDAYVLSANCLSRFQGHAKPSEDMPRDRKEKKDKHGPQVSRRRGKTEDDNETE